MAKPSFWDNLPRPLIYLAPMSGITNKPYRQMVKKYHSDIVFPEFVSTYALHYGSEKSMQLLDFDEMERPIVAQIFGAEPQYFYASAKLVEKLGFDGVDINFGCPAPKVAKNGGGCALLGDLGLSREIIQAVLNAVDGRLPVSVKTRVSYKNTHVREFCKVIADLPLANLCVHGRSFEKQLCGLWSWGSFAWTSSMLFELDRHKAEADAHDLSILIGSVMDYPDRYMGNRYYSTPVQLCQGKGGSIYRDPPP